MVLEEIERSFRDSDDSDIPKSSTINKLSLKEMSQLDKYIRLMEIVLRVTSVNFIELKSCRVRARAKERALLPYLFEIFNYPLYTLPYRFINEFRYATRIYKQ